MSQNIVNAGFYAGLAVVAVIGVLLARRSGSLRIALAPYVGEGPARGAVYGMWFAYGVGAINALARVFERMSGLIAGDLPILGFVSSAVLGPVLSFVNSLVPVLHLVAVAIAAVVLYRHVRAPAA